MRGLIITLVLFAILLTAMMINFFYVEHTINYMKQMAYSLSAFPSEENTQIINNMEETWNKHSIFLSLSVSSEDIEDFNDTLTSLKASNMSNNVYQYKIDIELLFNAIEEIGRLERFSIKNIL